MLGKAFEVADSVGGPSPRLDLDGVYRGDGGMIGGKALAVAGSLGSARLNPSHQQRRQKRRPTDCVQFTSSIFFAEEAGGHVDVDLMRIGCASDTCSVEVYTVEGSAKAGLKFEPLVTTVEFLPGEILKAIQVKVFDDEHFDTTLEFECKMRKPFNCRIGRNLSSTRVLVRDDDLFPSNKFKKEIGDMIASGSDKEMESITISLLVEFMRFVFLKVPSIWWRTLLYLVLDQLHNVYYYCQILIKVYLVDVVLNLESQRTLLIPGNRYLTAMALALMWVLPNLVLLVVDRIKAGPLDTGRKCRAHLQVQLFRKYTNYSEESKCEVPVQDLTVAMNSDIPMLVEDGYQFVFEMFRALGKIAIVAYFMVSKDIRSAIPVIFYPTVMLIFIKARQTQYVDLEEGLMRAEAASEGCLVSVVESFEPIQNYRMRQTFSNKFEEFLNASRAENNKVRVFKFWNDQFVPWITLICVGVYLLFGAQLVLLEVQTLGSFLATIQIYSEMGDRFQGLYQDLQCGVQAGSPLVQLSKMLNLPTDIPDRIDKNKQRRQHLSELLEKQKAKDPGSILGPSPQELRDHVSFFDTVPITLRDLHISYAPALAAVNQEVHPGMMVFVTGGHGTGKTTLLRIISDVVVPHRGISLFAPHNRCLDVSNTPHIVSGVSLYENLCFGSKAVDPQRVRSIFIRLQLDKANDLLNMLDAEIAALTASESRQTVAETPRGLDPEDESALRAALLPNNSADCSRTQDAEPEVPLLTSVGPWQKRLSFSERKRLHLARALVFNPEILCVHKPVDAVDTTDVDNILKLLREFVDCRGVAQDPDTWAWRRPRTIFMTGGFNENTKANPCVADQVWTLGNEAGHGLVVKAGLRQRSGTLGGHSLFTDAGGSDGMPSARSVSSRPLSSEGLAREAQMLWTLSSNYQPATAESLAAKAAAVGPRLMPFRLASASSPRGMLDAADAVRQPLPPLVLPTQSPRY